MRICRKYLLYVVSETCNGFNEIIVSNILSKYSMNQYSLALKKNTLIELFKNSAFEWSKKY